MIPEALLADIDALVGKRGRSAFLSEVLEREVRRRKLLEFLERPEAAWQDEDHPELKRGARAWVEQLRREDEKSLQDKFDQAARD